MRPRGDDARPLPPALPISVHKPIRPAQLLEALCRALSVQMQREKKAPVAPTLDADLARRLPLRLLLADDNPINQKVGLSVLAQAGLSRRCRQQRPRSPQSPGTKGLRHPVP